MKRILSLVALAMLVLPVPTAAAINIDIDLDEAHTSECLIILMADDQIRLGNATDFASATQAIGDGDAEDIVTDWVTGSGKRMLRLYSCIEALTLADEYQQDVPPPPTAEEATAELTSFGSGAYFVGSEIQTGTYKGTGNGRCFAFGYDASGETIGSASGTDSAIFVVSNEYDYVEFTGSGDCTWKKVK